jgi:hypothetical protein
VVPLLRTIDEAEAFIAAQPRLSDPLAVHWLDQGSARLAERASIRRLQAVWAEGRDDAPVDDDPVGREAARLFRLVIAMAIVAKGRPSACRAAPR